jgi:hypothetical protein
MMKRQMEHQIHLSPPFYTQGDSAKKFVVAFGGHSSAAAHGNYFNESYAHAFQRLLTPVCEAAGIELVVRNHGELLLLLLLLFDVDVVR